MYKRQEFNLGNDVNAVNVVFGSTMPVWQVPKNVYEMMPVSMAELEYRVRPQGAVGRYLFDQLVAYSQTPESRASAFRTGESWVLGDNPAPGPVSYTHLIHPMGVIIDTDLRYLARVTGDGYYASRAADSAAWMLQCLELYPAATGYGRYGILSERWCPSDGLDVERFSDGRPFSSWFSHNLWASACVLEAACELLLESEHKKG